MKLKTTVAEDGLVILDGDISMSGDDQLEHDAAAAHAYKKAVALELSMPHLMAVNAKADELMREWGFDSGEAEGGR